MTDVTLFRVALLSKPGGTAEHHNMSVPFYRGGLFYI
ncbi:hypothetical protein JOC86_000305 [Bacillus pakistanensis]|uniref:Uncharacterized protein n=1 Tax=Rossellomorea pakistanensis TaxID=992288 RepID=A0ABS2N7G4_9BACI|nr:hypothetical protein [Bacillus pakistanensis]